MSRARASSGGHEWDPAGSRAVNVYWVWAGTSCTTDWTNYQSSSDSDLSGDPGPPSPEASQPPLLCRHLTRSLTSLCLAFLSENKIYV